MPATCKISVCSDLTIQIAPTGHGYVPAPPGPPVPAPAAQCLEMVANHFWPLGFASHSQTTTVRHRGQSISLDGHDLGRFIVHAQLTPAPNNIRLPLIIFKSSRKNNFKAPNVKMNGTAVGTFIMLNWPPMPMTSCAEPVAYPSACSTSSWVNSVEVGMSWATYLISALTLAANLLVDRLLWKREESASKALEQAGVGATEAAALLKEAKELRQVPLLAGLMTVEDTRALALKSLIATASSAASLAFTDDEGSFPLIAGAPFGAEITRTADGKYGAKLSATLTMKDGNKDALGQERSRQVSGSIAIGANAEGKVEGEGELKAKSSSGYKGRAQVKHTRDPQQGKASTGVEVSGQDFVGDKAAVKVEGSSDSRAHTVTEKDSFAVDSAGGSAQGSSSQTRDASFRLQEKEDAVTTSRPGGPRIETESKTSYPTDPKLGTPRPTQVNSGRIL